MRNLTSLIKAGLLVMTIAAIALAAVPAVSVAAESGDCPPANDTCIIERQGGGGIVFIDGYEGGNVEVN